MRTDAMHHAQARRDDPAGRLAAGWPVSAA
jgi:hypothetical protein